MRFLSLDEVLDLHERLVDTSGGAHGIRDLPPLESAMAQPDAGFGGIELYPDLTAKASALCFSLVMNHPFIDGNKRIGHAAMETFLILNGYELTSDIAEQEQIIIQLAAGLLVRDAFTQWVREHSTAI